MWSAARLMREHDIGSLPVVENQKNKKISGLITDRDLVIRVMAAGLDPLVTPVERGLSKPAIACPPDDGYDQTLALMEKHRVPIPRFIFSLPMEGSSRACCSDIWSGLARPRPGCVLRTLGVFNAYAAFIGAFNAVLHTNYMYLCRKPSSASLLDFFGPWPCISCEDRPRR